MDLLGLASPNAGKFLGIEWHAWKVVGWLGNIAFFSRFFIQWYASEKEKKIVVPLSFWYLSLIGSVLLLAYAVGYRHDSVFIFAYAFTWIPYIRNLVIAHRTKSAQKTCAACNRASPFSAKFCSECGGGLRD